MKVEIRSGKHPLQAFEYVSKVIMCNGNKVEIHHGGVIDEILLANNERATIHGNQRVKMDLIILGQFQKDGYSASTTILMDGFILTSGYGKAISYYVTSGDVITIEAVE